MLKRSLTAILLCVTLSACAVGEFEIPSAHDFPIPPWADPYEGYYGPVGQPYGYGSQFGSPFGYGVPPHPGFGGVPSVYDGSPCNTRRTCIWWGVRSPRHR